MSNLSAEDIQRACWEGDEGQLRLALRLDVGLEFALNSSFVGHALSTLGLLQTRPVTSSNPAKRPCLALEGTALEFAVRKSNFSCANLLLSVILARRLLHTGTIRAEDLGIRYPRMTAERALGVVMRRFCQSRRVRFNLVRNLYSLNGHRRLYTFLGCCFSGKGELVGKLLREIPESDWNAANTKIRLALRRNIEAEGPRSIAELGLLASSLGGDSSCIKLLLNVCHNAEVAGEAWSCLFKCSFVWTLSSLKNNVDLFQAAGIIRRVGWPYPHPFEVMALVVDRFASLKSATSNDLCLLGDLPTQDEILSVTWKVFEPHEAHFVAGIRRNLQHTLRLAVKVARSAQPSSEVFVAINRILRNVFISRPPNSLLDWNISSVLVELRPEQREAFLVTLCQFFRVQSVPHFRICPMCHPLVSISVRASENERKILAEHLHVITAYFSFRELDRACRLLNSLSRLRFCSAHRCFYSTLPSISSARLWTDQFVRLIRESKKSTTLSSHLVLAILSGLDGDVERLSSISMPGGLRRYFALDHFLHWWVPPGKRQ